MDRETRCVLSWEVVFERTTEALQACLERAPQAKHYYSDAFPVYDNLYYGAPYEMRTDKQEPYSVEAVNADLRHYLKRLARKSHCFTRRFQSLVKQHPTLCLLLQPPTIGKTTFSEILLSFDRLRITSRLGTLDLWQAYERRD